MTKLKVNVESLKKHNLSILAAKDFKMLIDEVERLELLLKKLQGKSDLQTNALGVAATTKIELERQRSKNNHLSRVLVLCIKWFKWYTTGVKITQSPAGVISLILQIEEALEK